ncbi:uncharacterized protein Bfra_011510 [Botrytis fragariae]|uniref:Uncharacterized protein n=1 Tax=Botrytis fragariae TaxID=1964551 RepID=A0A8H6EKM8_9HELO|nr:uncharacterized protein Bfra_011510 [Botrytis fragariae]KAF5875747.1 hypothetical protein Bfra_011510 [Botrytis fragariae]
MSTSLQLRDAAAQTDEDIFFDTPEELFEDALEDQEVRCIETHPYLANPDKDHYPDLPTLFLRDEIQNFNYREPAPYDVDDSEYEMLMVIEDCLTNLQEQYERKMRKEDSCFRRIMTLYDEVINRPHDPSKILKREALNKERTLYFRRLKEITRIQALLDREYLVEFTELKNEAVAIIDKWHSKQSSLAAVPQKLVVEEHIRWTLLRQKQLEYVHDKTKDLVNDQANRIRELEYALAVAQQAPAAAPFIYQTTTSMTQEGILADANNMTEEQVLADAYKMMYQQRMDHVGQNIVQLNAHIAQVDDVVVPNGQEQVSAEEIFAQAQGPHDFQNEGNPDLVTDSREIHSSPIADGQLESHEETNIPESRQPWNSQCQERTKLVANAKKNDDDTVSNGQTEIIEEGEIAQVEQSVNFQQQKTLEPDTNLPQDQSNFVTPNGQEEPITTGPNILEGQEHVDDSIQDFQQPAYPLTNPHLNASVQIVPDRQVNQNSYVNYMEYENDPGRMYPLHSSDPIKKAWARKKLDLDFEKKQKDTIDEIMQTGRNEAALKKWAETVSGLSQEISPHRRPSTHIIKDFEENEESDDEYGRKRTYGTYEEDEECEEEHSRKRVRPITQITRGTPAPSIVFEPTPDDSAGEEMWEEPAAGYVGHDGVYYDQDGRCQYTQAYAGQEYFDHDVNDGGYPVHQYTPHQPQQQSPSPSNAPVSRIRSYVSRDWLNKLSEFSNKEIAETVASLSIQSTISPFPFELSQIITMVLGFMVLMQTSLLSSPSNLMWLIKSIFSILHRFILKPYITLYKLVGPWKLLYLAVETLSIFLLIAFYYLYRGSIAGLGCGVKFHKPREAQSITGIPNISSDCQLRECTIYLSAWCNKPFNLKAMRANLERKSDDKIEVYKGDQKFYLGWKRRISSTSTEFIIIFKEMVGDLCARFRWTHAALLLLLVLVIQIPAVSTTARLIPGIILQCPGWTAGVFLTCYRYMESAVTAKAQLIPGIYDQSLVAAKEVLRPSYQYMREVFQEATAGLRDISYESMNEEFLKQRRSESMRAVEVGDGYEVVHDSKQAYVTRFRNANKIVRDCLFFLLRVWFLYSFVPWIFYLLQRRFRGAGDRRPEARP